MSSTPSRVSFLLGKLSDQESFSELITLVYGELRQIAGHHFRGEQADHLLQPTALVSELFLRWSKHRPPEGVNRAYFFAAASRAMRQILIEFARASAAQKRGRDIQRTTLEKIDVVAPEPIDYEIVDRALSALERHDARAAQIVELKIFGGLTSREIGELLGMGESTVRREWAAAREWLEEALEHLQ